MLAPSPLLSRVFSRLPSSVEFMSLQGNRLTVRMQVDMLTAERGHMLMELEKRLHREVDPEITVFLLSRADAEILRVKLRGVKV